MSLPHIVPLSSLTHISLSGLFSHCTLTTDAFCALVHTSPTADRNPSAYKEENVNLHFWSNFCQERLLPSHYTTPLTFNFLHFCLSDTKKKPQPQTSPVTQLWVYSVSTFIHTLKKHSCEQRQFHSYQISSKLELEYYTDHPNIIRGAW